MIPIHDLADPIHCSDEEEAEADYEYEENTDHVYQEPEEEGNYEEVCRPGSSTIIDLEIYFGQGLN